MSMKKTKTTNNDVFIYYIFRRNKKRLLVVVVMITLLTVLFYCNVLGASLSMSKPARRKYSECATRKLNSRDNGTTANDTTTNGATSHVLLYDYALEKAYLPAWFFNVSMAELSTRLRLKQRRKTVRDSPFVNVSSQTPDANWVVFQHHIRSSCLYDHDDPAVDGLLRDMATLPIVATEKIGSGTRLKLSVRFKDGGWAVMKALVKSHVDNKGRGEWPSCEIAAFHLDRVLDFCRVPPTVGRRVNIWSELASYVPKIQEMYINITEDGRVCFGRTFHIPHEACGDPDTVDVSLQHQLRDGKRNLLKGRINPWGYRHPDNRLLDLKQHTEQVCAEARAVFNASLGFDPRRQTLVDTLDASYLDMLTDNWDRHHFGCLTKQRNLNILFDNGKGFHDPSVDYMVCELLHERGGCCLMKKTTFLKFLKLFLGPQRLSDLMRESLRADPLAPVLSQDHLLSLNRRLDKIMAFITDCFKEHGVEGVLMSDINMV